MGIYIICYDRIVENVNADLYITIDNEKVGTLMGEALIQACPEGGNIFAINGSPTDRNVDEVVRGFNKAIEGSNLNVVYTEYCDNWMAELAGNYVTQGLEVTKDIVGVMCGNDDLASQANQERQNNIHPELATNIESFDNYDVIFIGYPIWWYQMPMAMYSFFDKYDFAGKTIIPFSTHGGSGWSGTLEDIAELEPDATMVNGYSISRNNTATSRDGILNWLQGIGMME